MTRVKEIHEYCRDNGLKMLSNFGADFWEVYRDNSMYFDRLFRNSYREFVAFNIDEDATIAEATVDWIFDVASFLQANEKRYSELWRLQNINDVDYSILDNYNVRETHATTATGSVSDSIGEKSETKTAGKTFGAYEETDSNSYVHGARSEADSETLDYDNVTTTTNGTVDTGSQQNTSENKVSAFNESSYSPKEYNDSNLGTRHDSTQNIEEVDSREDTRTGSHTEASYTDSESKSKSIDSHTDRENSSIEYSGQSNSRSTSDSENKTITKRGNMGIYSNSKLMSEHKELWEAFNFYKMIFDEIASEMLRIVYF